MIAGDPFGSLQKRAIKLDILCYHGQKFPGDTIIGVLTPFMTITMEVYECWKIHQCNHN
jgi:hypothetical protein